MAAASALQALLLLAPIVAQAPSEPLPPEKSGNGLGYTIHFARFDAQNPGDHREERLYGGFVLRIPDLQLEIRGENALLLVDQDVARSGIMQTREPSALRRGMPRPPSRRQISPEELQRRMEQSLRSLGKSTSLPATGPVDGRLEAVRFFYFEGGITVLRAGVEVIRCDRLWISPWDDRLVVENVELRFLQAGQPDNPPFLVRGARLEKSGPQWRGQDLQLTSCSAGVPHVSVLSGEATLLERGEELEVHSRGQVLQFGGINFLPLPDAHFFTGSQGQFPVKQARVGYSAREGAQVGVTLGLPWNSTGGALHEAITGRPAAEFRGDWELGVGYVEKRGAPLSGRVTYKANNLYEGETDGFFLDDTGNNLREILNRFDGSTLTNNSRGMIRTRNRIHLGPSTHLDIQAFSASDEAVLSEFYGGDYRNEELPETSFYLHHGYENHLFTLGTRNNLDRFSYRDDRSLANRFVEELPVATWNWVAQPIADLPWGTPVILDMATEVGQRRSNFDDLATTRVSDRTMRADQRIEVSTPFRYGFVNFRPFLATQGTYYDNTIAGNQEARIAWEVGVEAGTRFSRTWTWLDQNQATALRHVVAPRILVMNRFAVDDAPDRFHQFDATDAIAEQNLVRLELRNLVQRKQTTRIKNDQEELRDFLMVDVAQDIWPDATRDNRGEQLGLLYYDVRLRPKWDWMPFSTFGFALYGDHDWKEGLRTLDAELQFGPLAGLTWTAEYRTDAQVSGAVGLSASTRLFDRWDLFASGFYDLERDEVLTYEFGLRRNDHDWAIALTAGYDPFTDMATFRLDFQPTLAGLMGRRQDRFGTTQFHSVGRGAKY